MNPWILAVSSLIAPLVLFAICATFLRRLSPPEPRFHIVSLAALGFFSIVLVGLWCWPFDRVIYFLADAPFLRELFNAFVLAAIPEEFSRWIILRWRLGAASARLSSTRSLLLGGLVGLGFVMLENVAYALNGDATTVLERSFTAAPFHMLSGAIVGYFVGLSIATHKWTWSLGGVLLTIVLHGINNFNPRIFYELVLTSGEAFASSAFATIFVSGWPQNLVTLFVAMGVIMYLIRIPFPAKNVGESHPPSLR